MDTGKPLPILLDNQLHNLALHSKVSREALYGKTTTVIKDQAGTELVKGLLTPTGQTFLQGEYKQVTVDESGSFDGSPSYQIDGQVVQPLESSFVKPRNFVPVPLDTLGDFATDSVYPITPNALPPGLYAGGFSFTSRTVQDQDALLWVRAGEPSFLLVGTRKEFVLLDAALTYNLFDADEGEDEDEDANGDFGFGDL